MFGDERLERPHVTVEVVHQRVRQAALRQARQNSVDRLEVEPHPVDELVHGDGILRRGEKVLGGDIDRGGELAPKRLQRREDRLPVVQPRRLRIEHRRLVTTDQQPDGRVQAVQHADQRAAQRLAHLVDVVLGHAQQVRQQRAGQRHVVDRRGRWTVELSLQLHQRVPDGRRQIGLSEQVGDRLAERLEQPPRPVRRPNDDNDRRLVVVDGQWP